MKERSSLIILGFSIYIVMSAVDKFILDIPNAVYIPLGILGIALVVAGAFKKDKRRKGTKAPSSEKDGSD